MTVVISVQVSEGLVLAADSSSTVGRWSGDGRFEVFKVWKHSKKLAHLKDYPIGVLSWGTGSIGPRNIQSLIYEYERDLDSWELDEDYQVREIANELVEFLGKRYLAQFPKTGEQPALGVLISGYSRDQFIPEQYTFLFPVDEEIREARPRHPDGRPSLGANWYGQTDAILRLYKGFDPEIVEILSETGMTAEEIFEKSRPLEYPIIYDGMPLQDAIDLAIWLIDTTKGRFRFARGPEVVGGDIDMAVVTHQGFFWIIRKSWHSYEQRPLRFTTWERGGR